MPEDDIEVLKKIFDGKNPLKCPECGGSLIIIDLPSGYNVYEMTRNAYLECPGCGFRKRVRFFTIYGAVRDYDEDSIEVGYWSEMGSREINRFYHAVSIDLLKKLKESEELVEFLIVENTVVAIV